jgi:hypothetical protein
VDVDAVLAELFALIAPHLTEKQRRLLLGAGARALGCGRRQNGPHQCDGAPHGVRGHARAGTRPPTRTVASGGPAAVPSAWPTPTWD